MFDLEKAIAAWRHMLKNERAVFDEDLDELDQHLRDEIDWYRATGLTEERAYRRAIREMGSLGTLKDEYQKIYWLKAKHRHTLTDEIYWQLTMLKNYLTIALRNARKHKGFAFINVAGLGIGMACCILILLWVRDELSYDRFNENVDDIYRVVQDIQFSDHSTTWGISQGPLGPGLQESFPEIIRATRVANSRLTFSNEGQAIDRLGAFVDPAFLEMFTYPLLAGETETALDDPNSIILTEELAAVLLAEENPMGKVVVMNDVSFTVTGVMQNVPPNSSLQFEWLSTMDYALQIGYSVDRWNNSTFGTYVQLEKGSSGEEVTSKISDFLYSKPTLEDHADLRLQPVTDLHLRSNIEFDLGGQGDIAYVYTFSIVALFILLVACINFMNLSMARSSNRAREVGMRKVVGANRKNLAAQFYGESMLLSIISLFGAVGIVLLALPWFGELANKELTLSVTKDFDILVGLVLILLAAGIVAGSYPAAYLSSVKPVTVLRGGVESGTKGSNFRGALVVLQFSLSIILIIGTLIVYGQIEYVREARLGYKKEHVVTFFKREGFYSSYETVKNKLLENPRILNATSTSSLPTYGYAFSNSLWEWEGQAEGEEILIRANFVDYDYVETLEIEMAAGRSFSRDFPSDSAAVLINETAAQIVGYKDPVGQWVSNGDRRATIIGVVKNYNYRSLHSEIEPLILILIPDQLPYMALSIASDGIEETLAGIEKIWDEFVAETPFEYSFLDERLDRMYSSEQRTSKLLSYFALLAILISSLGLLGLAAHAAERRTKEVGVRKVMGASTSGIVVLLSRSFLKWALLGNIIAWPLAFVLASRWLDNFAYKMPIQWYTFVLAAALAIIIALLTVSYQAIRASKANPVDALKYE